MGIKYTWSFPTLEVKPHFETQENVVSVIHWVLTGELASAQETLTGSVYGSLGVEYKAGDPFTPYAQLTEHEVQSWTENLLGADQVAAMRLAIQRQIEEQQDPSIKPLPPPWAALGPTPVSSEPTPVVE
jgi:hypothetical protein